MSDHRPHRRHPDAAPVGPSSRRPARPVATASPSPAGRCAASSAPAAARREHDDRGDVPAAVPLCLRRRVETGGIRYVDFLVPGYLVTSVLFTGSEAATGVAEDMEQGVTDRFRSLPVSRAAVVVGRVLAEWVLLTLGLVVTAAIGVAVGFRPDGTALEVAAAFGLCSLFGFGALWLFALVGVTSGNVQAAQGMSMMIFPLSFVSSAYVPVDSMPGWLQAVAEHQPVTVVTDAVRSLALGDPAAAGLDGSTAGSVGLALAWTAGLVAVFAPLAVQRYRRP